MAETSGRKTSGFYDPPTFTGHFPPPRNYPPKTRFERIAEILEVDRIVWEGGRWEIGRIVDLLDWGVGISIYREYDPGHQVGLWFEIGPFAWWLARRVQ